MKKSFTVYAIPTFIVLSTLSFFACQKKESPKTLESNVSTKSALPVDSMGELDPIANPAAISGGTYTAWGGSFPKSLNMWLDYNSFSKEIMSYLFESLVSLHPTKDEPIGILAKSWEISPDGKSYTFLLDPRARWSDGIPITAIDVQFYYDVIMNPIHMTPIFRVGLKRFNRPEVVDSLTLRISATQTHWGNFWEAAGLSAFPYHVWGKKNFNDLNFDFPVVSGPYAIDEIKKERYVSLKRRQDWWGRVKRFNQNKFNFEKVKFRFMADQNKLLEAFKKGEFDFYPVYTASIWVGKTDFDQVKKGWVVRQRVFNREPIGFQGFAFNLRRPLFQDIRIRKALSLLIHRELMNEKLMYNQYFLLNSYYPDLYPNNQNLQAPNMAYNPEMARSLLSEAGWNPGPDGILAKNGKRFEISIPTVSPDFRHLNVFIEDLKKVGIQAKIEQISESSLRKRLDGFDYDLYWAAWGASRLRDPEASWISTTADQQASNNLPGVKDKIIDSLIEAQKTEFDLSKRNDILRKLDKRLTTEIMPYGLLWQIDHSRLLYWNRFGTPKYTLDKYDREESIVQYWYIDPTKEKTLNEAIKQNQPLPLVSGDVRYQE